MAKLVLIKDTGPGMIIEENVYSKDNSALPLITKGTKLTPKLIEVLKRNDIQKIQVEGENEAKPEAEDDNRQTLVISDSVKTKALYGLEELFTLAETAADKEKFIVSAPKIVKELDQIVMDLVGAVIEDENTMVNIESLKSYDDYTYHHSLSVAVLALAIGQSYGLSRRNLEYLGKAALMHDIGKIYIPIEIINKPGFLSESEYELVKTHSQKGYTFLIGNGIGSSTVRKAVLHHHEHVDGSGYPAGLRGSEIPILSRIIALADVYDAITSKRTYRAPLPVAEALEYIMGSVDTLFDYDVVKAFMKKVEIYKVGSYVQLSNGSTAKVLNAQNLMRPVIEDTKDGSVIDLMRDKKYLNVTIKNTVEIAN